MTANRLTRRLALLATLILAISAISATAAHSALAAPVWRITSLSNTSVQPGGNLTYNLEIANVGDAAADGSEVTLNVSLPAGMTGVSADTAELNFYGGFDCSASAGATDTFTCTGPITIQPEILGTPIKITVALDSDASGVLTTEFELGGGGAPAPARTVDPVRVTDAAPQFGFDAFDAALLGDGGAPFTQAAGHPRSQMTALDFTTHTDSSPVVGDAWPLENVRDVTVSLPPGLLGNPARLDQCTLAELANGELDPHSLCSPDSQLGEIAVRHSRGALGPIPVYNMAPPPGVPARFGFNTAGTIVVLDAHVRSGGDYGIDVSASNVPQGLAVVGNTIELWGVPADPAHEPRRSCPGEQYPWITPKSCSADSLPAAFLRTPTACVAAGEFATAARGDSWQHPGDFFTDSVPAHQGPGYPYAREDWGDAVGIDGCDQVPFDPTLDAALTTDRADSPTGLTVDIGLPADCWEAKATAQEAEDALCQSDMREAALTLPQGLSLNPSSADGLAACSPEQIGAITFHNDTGGGPRIRFDEAPVSCPDAAKIGTVEIETPLLARHDSTGKPVTDAQGDPIPEPLTGSVYLASQGNNPFDSLLAMYLVAEGSGVVIKQAGEIELGPDGRITTRFDEVPQQPFSKIHVELFGGPRAALRTPATCGTYTASGELTPWSGNGAVNRQSSFQVSQGCGSAFDPQMRSGAENPLAGATSPFNLRLTRADATQELSGLQVKLPPGLSGYLADVPYCPDPALASLPREAGGEPTLGTGAAQEASPSCPAASRIGTVTVGAGAGPNPFYTSSGRVYLAGPYRGAPLSLAVVAPAVAGPFDLGTVVVRNAIRVDPASAQLTVDSDPLPTIVHGIPLDLRDVRVQIDRDHFTLNPTNCDPLSVDATLTSTQGATAQRSNHFQAANCERLGFKPRLSFALKGAVHRRAHPQLTATLRARAGDANIARAQVKLPPAAFLDNDHIKGVCTRVQFAAHACPANSIYGKAEATSPILGYPLAGNVYLRSSDHKLPDLVVDLQGPSTQPIEIALAGRTDSVKGALRNTFELVPDAPVTKFKLTLFGRKRGLIEMSSGFCADPRATVRLDAHNGRGLDANPTVKAACGKKSPKHNKKKGAR